MPHSSPPRRGSRLPTALALLAPALAAALSWNGPRPPAARPPLALAQSPRWALIDQAGGVTRAVAWDGRWLYVGVGPRLYIVGRCGRPEPSVVGWTDPLPGVVHDVAVAGDRAWVALGAAGVAAVDVGNPATPREGPAVRLPGAVADVPGEALALALAGERLWVGGTAGVHALDVSRGIARLAGHLVAPEGGFGGAVLDLADDADGRAYAAWSMHGLRVLEWVDGSAGDAEGIREIGPDPRGSWFAEAVDVADGIAWVAGAAGMLRAIDVADPARPRERSIAPFTEPEEPMGDLALEVAGDRVLVAGADAAAGDSIVVQALTADPALPRRVGEVNQGFGPAVASEAWVPGGGTALAVAWPYPLVAADRYGLAPLFDRSPGAADPPLGAWDHGGWLVAVPPGEAVAGGVNGGWLAGGSRGPAGFAFGLWYGAVGTGSPAWFGGSYAARDVAALADGPTALVAADALLRVGPATAPGTRATLLDTLTERIGLERVAADQGLAVAAGPQGLVVVDGLERGVPEVRATLAVTDPVLGFSVLARDVAVDAAARRAALVDGTWLHVFDLTDPAEPRAMAQLEVPGSTVGVALAGATAWVATEFGGLVGVDLVDPRAPRIASIVPGLEGARAVAVGASGERAYVALGAAGVAVVRLHATPAVQAVVDTPGTAVDVATFEIHSPFLPPPNDGVWVADREGGVVLLADAENRAGPRSAPMPTSCPLPPGTLLLPFAAKTVGMP